MINVRITAKFEPNVFLARKITTAEIIAEGPYDYVMYCMAYRQNGDPVYNVVENVMDNLTAVVSVKKV